MATEVVIPSVGYGMIEATIVAWLKEVGMPVVEGEPLLIIETEKTTAEVTSPANGVLRHIGAPVGTVTKKGQLVGILADEREDISEMLERCSEAPKAADAKAQSLTEGRAPATAEVLASPAARRAAKERGVDLAHVVGTGPQCRIVKADVLRFVEENKAETAMGEVDDKEVIPLIGIRKSIADRLTLSKTTAADVTTVAEVDMGKVRQLREGESASYTAFVVKAAAEAIKSFPILNSTLVVDSIHIKEGINIGVAVATDRGLVVPVIKHADMKSLPQISEEIARLGEKGRDGLLTPDDFVGGTFSVTNSGTFGSLFFTPIINYPEAAVLGMGKVFETPVVRDHEISIGWLMYLCLTYDHRIIDGAPAVRFVQEVKWHLENPAAIMGS